MTTEAAHALIAAGAALHLAAGAIAVLHVILEMAADRARLRPSVVIEERAKALSDTPIQA